MKTVLYVECQEDDCLHETKCRVDCDLETIEPSACEKCGTDFDEKALLEEAIVQAEQEEKDADDAAREDAAEAKRLDRELGTRRKLE